jgi:hypothetical protein
MARTKESARKGAAAADTDSKKKEMKKKAPKVDKSKSKAGTSFVVTSLQEYPADGFHSHCPGETEIDSVHKTAAAANKRARDLFWNSNPWGLDVKEAKENWDVEEDSVGGLLSFSVCPPDSEMWEVKVKAVEKK